MTYLRITVKYNINNHSLNIITFFKFTQKKFNVLVKKKEASDASFSIFVVIINRGNYQIGMVDPVLENEQVPLLLVDHHAF